MLCLGLGLGLMIGIYLGLISVGLGLGLGLGVLLGLGVGFGLGVGQLISQGVVQDDEPNEKIHRRTRTKTYPEWLVKGIAMLEEKTRHRISYNHNKP
jgi:hypothetical protein